MTWLLARPERFVSRPVSAAIAGSVLVVLVVLAALVIPSGPIQLEQRWLEAMQDAKTPFLTDVALVFNALGRGVLRALSLVLVGIALCVRRRWAAVLTFAATEALAPLLSSAVKFLVHRPRPPDGLVHAAGSSFPSGHATYAGATCVTLVLLFTSVGPRRRAWWALAVLGILGMAWSRTYLQVHWLLDVTFGSLLG